MVSRSARLVFFGTPDFAVPSLRRLLDDGHDVVAAVTQPDRPSGRGHHLQMPPVKALARSRGVTVLQPEKIRTPEFHATLAGFAPDLGIVAAYGKLLPGSLLRVPRLGMVNVHASLLPRYRGAAPIQRAVIAGESETGVTIMQVVEALDAGPILAMRPYPIGPDETAQQVEQALAVMGAGLLAETLPAILDGTLVGRPQEDALATQAPRLTKEEGAVDWRRPAHAIHNLVRGLTPWPRAYTHFKGERVLIHRTRVEHVAAPDARPGEIVSPGPDGVVVACSPGSALTLIEVQPEGRRAMAGGEFAAGRRMERGDAFDLPLPS